MLKVKPIPFPSFDKWWAAKDRNGNHSWSCRIGDFWAEVEPFSWKSSTKAKPYSVDTTVYAFAIAANEVPSNVYVDKVFWSAYEHYSGDDDETVEQRDDRIRRLCEWYDATVIKANKAWAEYIVKSYLIDEEEVKSAESLMKE